MEKKNCTYCGKTIKRFGELRKNGKAGKHDWLGRPTHSKCYREIHETLDFLERKLRRVKTNEEKISLNAAIEKQKEYIKCN